MNVEFKTTITFPIQIFSEICIQTDTSMFLAFEFDPTSDTFY